MFPRLNDTYETEDHFRLAAYSAAVNDHVPLVESQSFQKTTIHSPFPCLALPSRSRSSKVSDLQIELSPRPNKNDFIVTAVRGASGSWDGFENEKEKEFWKTLVEEKLEEVKDTLEWDKSRARQKKYETSSSAPSLVPTYLGKQMVMRTGPECAQRGGRWNKGDWVMKNGVAYPVFWGNYQHPLYEASLKLHTESGFLPLPNPRSSPRTSRSHLTDHSHQEYRTYIVASSQMHDFKTIMRNGGGFSIDKFKMICKESKVCNWEMTVRLKEGRDGRVWECESVEIHTGHNVLSEKEARIKWEEENPKQRVAEVGKKRKGKEVDTSIKRKRVKFNLSE